MATAPRQTNVAVRNRSRTPSRQRDERHDDIDQRKVGT
jgi:hypothetical protein